MVFIRRNVSKEITFSVISFFNLGMGRLSISKEVGLGEGVVRRILKENNLKRGLNERTDWRKTQQSKYMAGRYIGEKNPCFGKKLSKKTKKKISQNRKGKCTGKDNPLYGKTGSEHPCFGKSNNWGNHTQEAKDKISKAFRGSNHSNWQGGKTDLSDRIRKLREYKHWRSSVYKRDDYTCLFCGSRGKKLNADHIKPFSVIIKENNIMSVSNALDCKELWDINNGRTLCIDCHRKTETFGKGAIQ